MSYALTGYGDRWWAGWMMMGWRLSLVSCLDVPGLICVLRSYMWLCVHVGTPGVLFVCVLVCLFTCVVAPPLCVRVCTCLHTGSYKLVNVSVGACACTTIFVRFYFLTGVVHILQRLERCVGIVTSLINGTSEREANDTLTAHVSPHISLFWCLRLNRCPCLCRTMTFRNCENVTVYVWFECS